MLAAGHRPEAERRGLGQVPEQVVAALPTGLHAAVGECAQQLLPAQPSSTGERGDDDHPGLLDRLVGDAQLRAAGRRAREDPRAEESDQPREVLGRAQVEGAAHRP